MRATCALALILFALTPGSAVAGVDIDPATLSPRLFIEAERKSPSTTQTTNEPATASRSKPVYQPVRTCRVDPVVGLYGCRDVDPADPDTPEGRDLTEGDILNAVREIGLPSLQVQIQPGDETLVNIPTIFYTEPQAFARSIDLLGFDIDLRARPASYRWVHGDGTTKSTARPGRPYPAFDVTHRYRAPADGVRARVDVTYRVRYRVDGGSWQTLGQTLLASGPTAAVDVKEAAPVLTKP